MKTDALIENQSTPHPGADSLAPAHSALGGPSPVANSFRSFPSSGSLPDRGGEGGAQRPALRLPAEKKILREQMKMRQLQEAAQSDQAYLALAHEVQLCAKALDLDAKEAARLAQVARAGFRIVNGEPVPVAADRQSVVLGPDGVNVMTVEQWVRKQSKHTSPRPSPLSGEGDDDEVLPRRNPFRRKTWNLTEQMQLARRDPKLARRLKAEAVAEGEN